LATSREAHAARATCPNGGGDRGVRGSVRTRRDGKTTPTATPFPKGETVRPAKANRPEREAGDLLERAGAKASDAFESRRGAGARTKNVRWQKSVRRIARRPGRGAARQVDGAALTEELSARCADAHDGGSEARTVREVVRHFETRKRARPGRAGQPTRARHDGRRSDCLVVVPQGAASGRSWSRGSRRGVCRKACVHQLPTGPGTGKAVPAMTTKGVRDRTLHGEGCSSRRGASGPSHEAP